jgi:hypothetical protein
MCHGENGNCIQATEAQASKPQQKNWAGAADGGNGHAARQSLVAPRDGA